MNVPRYDVLVIGGGVIGTAVAARLSLTKLTVCLTEKSNDVADGASKGNAGVASSYYSFPGSLEAKLTTATVFRWEDICQRLNVPFRRIGALMLALNEAELEALELEKKQALACGVRAELLSQREATTREPMISKECLGALYLPDEGVIDPMRLTWAFAEVAAHNGVDVKLNSPVVKFEKVDGKVVKAITPTEVIFCRYVVNCTGLHADEISSLADGELFRMWPRKGNYWILDREFGSRLNHIIFSSPSIDTKGIHVVPTTRGSVLLGPTAEDGENRNDKSTDINMLTHAFDQAKKLVPSVSLDYVIKTYAGLRPASDNPFFVRIDRNIPNLIHAVSRSIGVSTSLGIADYIVELLQTIGLPIHDSKRNDLYLSPKPIFRHVKDSEAQAINDQSYHQIVCVCEQVTAAEIQSALTAKVPAQSLEGIWKRTGAMGGRCQGSMCLMGVTFMCAMHMKCSLDIVSKKNHLDIRIDQPTRS